MLPSSPEGFSQTPTNSAYFGAKESMKQSVLVLLVVFGVCAGVAKDANAQGGTWADRGYVNIGFGVESGSSSLTDTANLVRFTKSRPPSRPTTTWTSGSLVDAGFGVRVWRNLTVGIAYHQEENDTDCAVTGSIPSPIFFNRPRTLDQEVVLERKEKAAHLVIGWVVPLGAKLDVSDLRRALVLPARAGRRLATSTSARASRRSPRSWRTSTLPRARRA